MKKLKPLIYMGRDIKGDRLKRTWEHMKANHLFSMPSQINTIEFSTGKTQIEDKTLICSIEEYGWQRSVGYFCPKGMITDGMTIPWWARSIAKPKGKGFRAAMLHDMLTNDSEKDSELIVYYSKPAKTTRTAPPVAYSWNYKAEVFYYALRYCGFSHFRAYLIFLAVVWHGRKKI